MPMTINKTISQVGVYLGVLVPLIAGITYLASIIATETQLAEVRNELSISNNEIRISLMYLKYKDVKLEGWSIEDRSKYDGLIEARHDLEKVRKELSGIPEGLPK